MTTNREMQSMLLALTYRMVRLRVYLEHNIDLIRHNTFDSDSWAEWNYREYVNTRDMRYRYATSDRSNMDLLHQLDLFAIYWHHVIDFFVRETPERRVRYISFIEERIEITRDLENLFREEMRRFPLN